MSIDNKKRVDFHGRVNLLIKIDGIFTLYMFQIMWLSCSRTYKNSSSSMESIFTHPAWIVYILKSYLIFKEFSGIESQIAEKQKFY